jgi:hypothetical protein
MAVLIIMAEVIPGPGSAPAGLGRAQERPLKRLHGPQNSFPGGGMAPPMALTRETFLNGFHYD